MHFACQRSNAGYAGIVDAYARGRKNANKKERNRERKNSIVRKDGLNLKSVVFKKCNGKQRGNGKRKTGRAKVAHSFVECSLTRELACSYR